MATRNKSAEVPTTVWDRVFRFAELPSATAARALLKIEFSSQERTRMSQLAAKARAGTLTAEEEQEITTFEQLGCVLDILHSNARRSLKPRRSAS